MEAKKKSSSSNKAVAALTVAVVCAVAAAMLMAARKPAPAASPDAAAIAQPETVQVSASDAPVAAKPAVKKAPAKMAAAKNSAAVKTPVASKAPAVEIATVSPAEKPQILEAETKPTLLASSVNTIPAGSVTINGCLERDGDAFRLKDTDGTNTPKARSWKSGFLKKGSPKIGIVDPASRLKLKDHVGERVTVTGVLVDREMQARSLQRVATSCE